MIPLRIFKEARPGRLGRLCQADPFKAMCCSSFKDRVPEPVREPAACRGPAPPPVPLAANPKLIRAP